MFLQLKVCESKQSVHLIFCPNWPRLSVPVSNCFQLVDCVTRLSNSETLTLVIDSFGTTEASIFCVLSSLVRMMESFYYLKVFICVDQLFWYRLTIFSLSTGFKINEGKIVKIDWPLSLLGRQMKSESAIAWHIFVKWWWRTNHTSQKGSSII